MQQRARGGSAHRAGSHRRGAKAVRPVHCVGAPGCRNWCGPEGTSGGPRRTDRSHQLSRGVESGAPLTRDRLSDAEQGLPTGLPPCRCWICRQRSADHATVHRLARTRAEAAAASDRGWPCVSCGGWIRGASGEDDPLCERCAAETSRAVGRRSSRTIGEGAGGSRAGTRRSAPGRN